MNNKGQTQFLTFGLIAIVLLGGMGIGSKISNLLPSFKNKVYTEKSEANRTEYYRDKIKGVEYKIEERSKNRTPVTSKETWGGKIGRIIDNSRELILWYIIIGLGILFLTGFNIFKWTYKKIKELKAHRKTNSQIIRGVQEYKGTLTEEERKRLAVYLKGTTDEDARILIDEIKGQDKIK